MIYFLYFPGKDNSRCVMTCRGRNVQDLSGQEPAVAQDSRSQERKCCRNTTLALTVQSDCPWRLALSHQEIFRPNWTLWRGELSSLKSQVSTWVNYNDFEKLKIIRSRLLQSNSESRTEFHMTWGHAQKGSIIGVVVSSCCHKDQSGPNFLTDLQPMRGEKSDWDPGDRHSEVRPQVFSLNFQFCAQFKNSRIEHLKAFLIHQC